MSSSKPTTKERILDATRQLLEANNGQPVTMSDIAKQSGVSRQAVYLHFPNRADLLIATTRHIDTQNDMETLLEPSRTAASGLERLDAYINVWGNYIPHINGVAKALMAMGETDEAAAAAWDERMQAVRHGCAAAIVALERDRELSPDLSTDQATDILWTLLSVRNWEQFTVTCGLSQADYIKTIKRIASRSILAS